MDHCYYIGNRGSGRTTNLIKEAIKRNVIIVCQSKSSINYIEFLAKKIGINNLPKPITFFEFEKLPKEERERSLYLIDDIEYFLQSFNILGGSIDKEHVIELEMKKKNDT